MKNGEQSTLAKAFDVSKETKGMFADYSIENLSVMAVCWRLELLLFQCQCGLPLWYVL